MAEDIETKIKNFQTVPVFPQTESDQELMATLPEFPLQ